MIISLSLLTSAAEKYKEKHSMLKKHSYTSATYILLIVSILFFMLEVIVMFFAINIAVHCTEKGPERTVHLILAITFTFPYMLMSIFFNKCANKFLKNNNKSIPKEVVINHTAFTNPNILG